jgi:hypothetical protein
MRRVSADFRSVLIQPFSHDMTPAASARAFLSGRMIRSEEMDVAENPEI